MKRFFKIFAGSITAMLLFSSVFLGFASAEDGQGDIVSGNATYQFVTKEYGSVISDSDIIASYQVKEGASVVYDGTASFPEIYPDDQTVIRVFTGDFMIYEGKTQIGRYSESSPLTEEDMGKVFTAYPIYEEKDVLFRVISAEGEEIRYSEVSDYSAENVGNASDGSTIVFESDFEVSKNVGAWAYQTNVSVDLNGHKFYQNKKAKNNLFRIAGTVNIYSSKPGAALYGGFSYTTKAAAGIVFQVDKGAVLNLGYKADSESISDHPISIYAGSVMQISGNSEVNIGGGIWYICTGDNKGVITFRNSAERTVNADGLTIYCMNPKVIVNFCNAGESTNTATFRNCKIYGSPSSSYASFVYVESKNTSNHSNVYLIDTSVYNGINVRGSAASAENGGGVAYVHLDESCRFSYSTFEYVSMPEGFRPVREVTEEQISFHYPMYAIYDNDSIELTQTSTLSLKLAKDDSLREKIYASVTFDTELKVKLYLPKDGLYKVYIDEASVSLDASEMIDGTLYSVAVIAKPTNRAYEISQIEVQYGHATDDQMDYLTECYTFHYAFADYMTALLSIQPTESDAAKIVKAQGLARSLLYYVKISIQAEGLTKEELGDLDRLFETYTSIPRPSKKDEHPL